MRSVRLRLPLLEAASGRSSLRHGILVDGSNVFPRPSAAVAQPSVASGVGKVQPREHGSWLPAIVEFAVVTDLNVALLARWNWTDRFPDLLTARGCVIVDECVVDRCILRWVRATVPLPGGPQFR